MTYTATVTPKGKKFEHAIYRNRRLIGTRGSAKQYAFVIIVTTGEGEPFIGGWASKPRIPGSKMEKYWTVIESVPVEPIA